MTDIESYDFMTGLKMWLLCEGIESLKYKNSKERLEALTKITESLIEFKKADEKRERK